MLCDHLQTQEPGIIENLTTDIQKSNEHCPLGQILDPRDLQTYSTG